jgi:hypothetical protein
MGVLCGWFRTSVVAASKCNAATLLKNKRQLQVLNAPFAKTPYVFFAFSGGRAWTSLRAALN